MKAYFTKFHNSNNWVNGKCENYDFEAKLFDEGSEFGINEGRVSKLTISDNGNWIVNYDRGWDIEVKKEHEEVFNLIMNLLESSEKRFE